MDETKQQIVERLVQASHPDATIGGLEELFAAIIDDYEEYGRLIEAQLADDKRRADVEQQWAISQQTIDQACESMGLSADDRQTAVTMLNDMRSKAIDGVITPQCAQWLIKGLRYDADVAAAEVNGRNSKIEEQLMAPTPSDGVPHLQGSDSCFPSAPQSLFDMARINYRQ